MITKNSSVLYEQLRTALNDWVELTDTQWKKFASIFQIKNIQKQEYILLPGERVHKLVFVCEGLLRFYYISEKDTENNKAFIAENMFAGPLGAFALDLPVIYGIEALEPTTLLSADYRDFVSLFDDDPVFDRIGRKLAEWLLTQKELRTRSLLQQQAKERYLDFLEQYPNLIQRVSQYHIASYLGITEVSLSRLRNNLTQKDFS